LKELEEIKLDKKAENALLNAFVKSTGKTAEELKPLLDKAIQEAKDMGYEGNQNIIEVRLRKKVSGMLYSEKTGKTFTKKEPYVFRGFLLGADALRDIRENMRRKALRIAEEDPETAKLQGIIDEQGTPLDARTTIRNRKGEEIDNPDYHKPLLGHQYVRDILGVVKKEGDKVPKLFTMSLWGGFAEKMTWRPFSPMEFSTTIKSEGQYYVLNSPRVAKGEKAFKMATMEIDYEDWVRKATKGRTYELTDLDNACKATKDASDPWIAVEGVVDNINPDINPKTGSRWITLADGRAGMIETVRVFLPKDFPIGFREYSRVIAIGRPRKWRRTEEEDYQFSLNGISVYPLPGQVMEAKLEKGASAEGLDTEETEGWDLFE
jgi:hypothetical protein